MSCALVPAALATALGQTTPRDGYLRADDGVRLYYRVVGSGPDTLIAIHGGPGVDLESIAGDFVPLEQRHVVVFYDQRGAGRSELPADTSTLVSANQIRDLDAVRRFFHLDKVTLIAHSYGPLLAATYAIAHPDHTARMILMGPVPPRRGDWSRRFGASLNARLDSTQRRRQADAMRRLADRTADSAAIVAACRDYWSVGMRPRLAEPDRTLPMIKSDLCGSSPRGIQFGLTVTNPSVMRSYGDYDLRSALRTLAVRTLVIHGQQEAIPMDLVEEWVTSMPDARLLRVPRAAHFTYAERPDIVWPAIEQFLRGEWPPASERLKP